MHLDALFTLGAIVACACAAGRGLNGATIDDGGGWMGLAAIRQTQQHPQVMHHFFKATGFQPALHLLINQ